jgi:hypothetical protein
VGLMRKLDRGAVQLRNLLKEFGQNAQAIGGT